jgi:fructose-1,6-bisphosphatase II
MTPLSSDPPTAYRTRRSDADRDDPTAAAFPALVESACLAPARAAALASMAWVGRGDPEGADGAATDAMRRVLREVDGIGTVVIGEGAKDKAPMLFDGEQLGRAESPAFDIAVDPLECTRLCAKGLPGALATIAIAEAGALAALTPAYYMDKLVASEALVGVVRLDDPPEVTVAKAARALGKSPTELTVVVLDKPRHRDLVARLHGAGVRVVRPSDGDVGGALAVLMPEEEGDLLMGIGGTPEGVMTACATRALGGFMEGRLAPQSSEEAAAIALAGLSVERVYRLEELVSGDAVFAATGITGGPLLRRPWRADGLDFTESLLVRSGTVRRVVESSQAGFHGDAGASPDHDDGVPDAYARQITTGGQ